MHGHRTSARQSASNLAREIGRPLKLPEEEIRKLRDLGYLHDSDKAAGMTQEEAFQIMMDYAGTQFDPRIIRALSSAFLEGQSRFTR
jgi:HD-GYP domain-containing protein (c-di-GMP phosphodiesterase class II)